MDERVFLRQNVLVEPLFNQWYAWSYLISPATSAMYVANQHLKIMQSFVSAPQIHVSALKNPAMIGGPFINYDAGRAGEVKALIDRTVAEQGRALKFAEAVQALDRVLAAEAEGYSLLPLYEKVPEALRGYVELVYDLNNHPSIRFMEGLLYKSDYYNPASQSVALSVTDKEDHPFIFSTPRLESEGRLHLRRPFSHEGWDELFRAKYEARPYGRLREALGIGGGVEEQLFASLFTGEGPRPYEPYAGDGVRVRYFGHACVLVEAAGVSIFCDPVVSYKHEGGIFRYTYEDLPDSIDYVLITHNHQDHCMFETLLQLRHRIRNIIVPKSGGAGLADPSLKLVLNNIGFRNVYEIDEMEEVEVAGGSITGLPFLGEHTDLNIRTKLAYLVGLRGRKVLLMADSNNIAPELYSHVHAHTGDVDVMFLGMECDGAPLTWAYGPLLTKPLMRKMDQSRRLDGSNYERGIDIVARFNPRQAYVYAMGQEPWLTYLTSLLYTDESRPIVESNRLVEECRRRGIASERLYGHKELHL